MRRIVPLGVAFVCLASISSPRLIAQGNRFTLSAKWTGPVQKVRLDSDRDLISGRLSLALPKLSPNATQPIQFESVAATYCGETIWQVAGGVSGEPLPFQATIRSQCNGGAADLNLVAVVRWMETVAISTVKLEMNWVQIHSMLENEKGAGDSISESQLDRVTEATRQRLTIKDDAGSVSALTEIVKAQIVLGLLEVDIDTRGGVTGDLPVRFRIRDRLVTDIKSDNLTVTSSGKTLFARYAIGTAKLALP